MTDRIIPLPTHASFNDLTGNVFSRLTVISYAGKRKGSQHWNCKCECGAETAPSATSLTSGNTQSCGCLHSDTARALLRTHGESDSAEAHIFYGMKWRCYNPNTANFSDYGGRGITICDRWLNDIETFFADMGKRPSPDHSIDRIDNDKGYSAENCRWTTHAEQMRNRRMFKINTSGHTGVSQRRNGKWQVSITVNSVRKWLGTFVDIDDAIAARLEAERKYW